jgi:hypothetical protein
LVGRGVDGVEVGIGIDVSRSQDGCGAVGGEDGRLGTQLRIKLAATELRSEVDVSELCKHGVLASCKCRCQG